MDAGDRRRGGRGGGAAPLGDQRATRHAPPRPSSPLAEDRWSRFRYWCRMVGIAAVAVSIAPVPAALASFGATTPVPTGGGFGDGACRGGGAGAYTREP